MAKPGQDAAIHVRGHFPSALTWLCAQDVRHHTSWVRHFCTLPLLIMGLFIPTCCCLCLASPRTWKYKTVPNPSRLEHGGVWRSCEGFPFRIWRCSPVFPGWASQPWRTPSKMLAGAEASYFWSLHKVPCYDYLNLRAFDSFAARRRNPCILVHLLHVFFFFCDLR